MKRESDLDVAVRKKLLVIAPPARQGWLQWAVHYKLHYKDADALIQSTLRLLGKKNLPFCLSTSVGAAAHTHDKAKFLT